MNHLHKNPASSNWAGRESEEIEYWHQAVIPLNDLEFILFQNLQKSESSVMQRKKE